MSPGNDRTRKRLFALLLLVQAGIYAWLILGHRIPRGHDTLSVYLLQSLFLSGPVSGSAPGLWMPYLAHGVTSAWLANIQSGFLQSALLLVGGVPEGTPMLPVFYAGLFLEDLALLIGVWRLGGRFFRSPAAQFFVAVSAVGSSLWVTNIFWSHRLLYGIPLAVSLLLDFLETGSRRRLLLAVSFGGLLLLGNAVYIPMLTGLSIVLFVGLYLWVHRKRLRASRTLLRPRPADAILLVVLLLLFGACLGAIAADLGSFRQFHRGRNPDGSVSLDSFLTYAGALNPLRYIDLLFGLTPSLDYSLYAGLCTPILAVLAFKGRPRKDALVVALSLLLILLFSMGYLHGAAMLGYTAIPPLHYFRYVGLAAGLVKLFLILLSGFGFDALVRKAQQQPLPAGIGKAVKVAAAGLLFQWVFLWSPQGNPDAPLGVLLWLLQDNMAQRTTTPNPTFLPAILLLAAGIGVLVVLRRRFGSSLAMTVPLLLLIHGTDLFRWRTQLLREETVILTDAEYDYQRVTPLPFVLRRSPPEVLNDRAREYDRHLFAQGVLYDYCDPFLHRDVSWSRRLVTQWSPPIDQLLRAHHGVSLDPAVGVALNELSEKSTGGTEPESYARIIGEAADKLQVFSAAHPAASDEEIAAILNRPDYLGNILILSDAPESSGPRLAPSLLGRNERIDADLRVRSFSPNRLELEVQIPANRPNAWLVYCDAWHPAWSATVDQSPQRVERANLAYKAVRLHAGKNAVEFRFRAPFRSLCYVLVGLQSLFWSLLLTGWALRLAGVARGDRVGGTPSC